MNVSAGARYWTARFATWTPALPAEDGYTLLVPVPGDLPVFLEMALTVCGLQQSEQRLETLVIPDQRTPAMDTLVDRARATWAGPLRMIDLPRPERMFLPRLKNPGHNHGVQIIAGIQQARGRHVILHDADLFPGAPDMLDGHYASTVKGDYVANGVSPVWDGWFAEHGLHLAATWELCAQRDWLRSFPPYLHKGHTAELFGEDHVFDTTLRAQAVTDPRRVNVDEVDDQFVHFNYVISTYRHFQRTEGTFVDDSFRILLIRLFVDLFADLPHDYALPTLAELVDGLRPGATGRVVYQAAGPEVLAAYSTFRGKLDGILDGAWVSPARAAACREMLAAFDTAYAGAVDTDAARPVAGLG